MKISHENLDLFKSNEYEEYLKLKRKNYSGETIGCFAGVILHFLIGSLVGILVLLFGGEWLVGFLIYSFALPCSAILSIIIGETIVDNTELTKHFGILSQKRNSYRRLNELDLYFQDVKKALKTQLNHYVADELNILIQEIKENRDNEVVLSRLTKTLLFNHKFVRQSSDILKTNNIFVNYKEKLKRNDIWFEDELKEAEELLRKKTQIEKLQEQTKVYSRKQSSKSPSISTGLKSNQKGEDEFGKKSQVKKLIQSQNSETDFEKTKPNEILENLILQENGKPEKQGQLTLFETEEKTHQNKFPLKQKLFKPRKIKATSGFWDALNKMKISIGKKGELLVLEYERKRIFSEESEEFADFPEHTSVVQGDGMGYDILSIENGEKIYIEVKTTTGSFRSNLIFTKNEFEAMDYYGKQYYLYRVYDHYAKNKTGNLRIFKGKEHINSIFNFNPHTFILEEK